MWKCGLALKTAYYWLQDWLNYNLLSIFEQMKSDRKCYIEGIRGSW